MAYRTPILGIIGVIQSGVWQKEKRSSTSSVLTQPGNWYNMEDIKTTSESNEVTNSFTQDVSGETECGRLREAVIGRR